MLQKFLFSRLHLCIFIIPFLTLACSPQTGDGSGEIEVDLSSFQIKDGYRIESVAAEPQIVAPVDMIFDSQGRMWVVEMMGYMTDFSGSKEEQSLGQISILEDHNGNGVADHKKLFLDSLVMPRSIAFANGGLLYAVPPDLKWVPILDGDRPGDVVLVDSAYAAGGNVEHQPNGLMYNVDNWLYNAKSNAHYRYRNGKWEKDYIFNRGQWGITQDEYGRLFYNDNSNQFRGDYFLPGILDQNKNLAYPPGVSMTIVEDQNVYPLQFTPVNRGYMEGVLDSVTHRLLNFTSASGPLYYTGGQYDGEFDDNSFVCGPEVNLVKRNRIETNGVEITGEQYYEDSEFLISEDLAFRPVSLRIGPDGWIYVIDMHRGIIQHKTYMTNYLRLKYQETGLDTIVDMGRILRILPEGKSGGAIPAMDERSDDLVNLLQQPNSWLRLYAQQQIVENGKTELVPMLKKLLEDEDQAPYVPIHAFWTLEGLDALEKEMVFSFAFRDDKYYLPHAVKYMTTYHPEWVPEFHERFREMDGLHTGINLIYRAALTRYVTNKIDGQVAFLTGILHKLDGDHKGYAVYMALSQYMDREEDILLPLQDALSDDHELVAYLKEVERKINSNKSFIASSRRRDFRDAGLNIFETNCSACHGRDGKGLENLAPPLYQSEYLEDRDSALIMIVLHGLQGPVEVGGKMYKFPGVMPALAHNTEYSDREIAAVLSFIKNAFSRKPQGVSYKLVESLREYPPPDGQPYTVESLEERLDGIGQAK